MWNLPTLLFLAAGCLTAVPVPDRAEVHIRDGAPCLVVDADEIARVRERTRATPRAAEVARRITAEADRLVAATLDIPRAEGQWSHWYVGAAGNRLEPLSPTEHLDPKTGEVYTGHPYDAVYVAMRHGYWLRGVQTLGMAHALTNDARYAERVRAILLEYASFYSSLAKHNKRGARSSSGARLFSQTLDEAVIACHIAAGYSLVHGAECFSGADHREIERGLLRPLARVIRGNDSGMSNWQAWHNAALGCLGFLLRDRRLVDRAVNGRHGLLYQLRRSTYGSGLWYELAPIYHWYALNACTYLFEAARRNGMDLYAIPRVRALYTAPVRLVLPDGTFAPMHDSDRLALSDDRWYLEVAYARYGGPFFAAAAGPRPEGPEIEHRSESLPESRTLGLEAAAFTLFWGEETLPVAPFQPRSSNDRHEGLAVLRDAANETAILFDYGPALEGHAHPAKLGMVLFAGGDIRLVDPGRAPYAHPLQHGWYRRTIAHNTVAVDEQDQRPAAGRLRAFAAREDWALVRADTADAYPGVTLDRTLLLAGDVVADVFQCRGGGAHTFDLPLHLRGELRGLPERRPAETISGEPGYRELWDTAPFAEPVKSFTLIVNGEPLRVTALDASKSWFALGHGPIATGEPVPVVLRRQRGTQALFVTVYSRNDAPGLRLDTDAGVCVRSDTFTLEPGHMETRLSIHGRTWHIGPNGAREAPAPDMAQR